MNKKWISFVLALGLMVSASGCGDKDNKDNTKKAGSSEVNTGVNVTVSEATSGNVEEIISYTGEVRASNGAGVSSKASGIIERIYVDKGDYVKAGAVLMKVDDTQYVNSYEQAKAAYNQTLATKKQAEGAYEQAKGTQKQAQATYKQAQGSYQQAQASVSQTKAAYESALAGKAGAEASYNNATSGSAEQTRLNLSQALANAQSSYDTALNNYNRQKALFDIGSISQVALDSAKTTMDNAKIALDTAKRNVEINESVLIPQAEAGASAGVAQADAAVKQAEAAVKQAEAGLVQAEAGLSQAEAAVRQAEAGIGQAEAGISQAEATIEQARVSMEIAQRSISDCTVVAPVSGYITAKNANIGQMASPGIEFFTIKDTSTLEVEINVTEAVISSLSISTPANISIKSAGISLKGAVGVISNVKDDATGMYLVKIALDNSDGVVKAGMLADVSLVTEGASGVLTIVSDSVMLDGSQNYVYVAEGNKAVRKDVVLGVDDGERVQVISGLSEGDLVIVEGKDFVTDKNNEIRIVEQGE